MNLSNKRILITAGPTWVAIDTVRVISNIATGQTGILLAERLLRLGSKITLLLGPVDNCCLSKKIKLIRFKFFDELRSIINRELRAKKYDAVIHSAAVADYKPEKVYRNKIKSAMSSWKLKLISTAKIIDSIKKIKPSLLVVGFKFEPKAGKNVLIKKARELMQRANLDFAVANTIDKKYTAYIINNNNQIIGPVFNRNALAEKLIMLIGGNLWKD